MATEIKICGLKTRETLDACVAAGATHVGLNLYGPSPRYVPLTQARALRDALPPTVKSVLLLVSMDAKQAAEAIAAVQPDVVQFHGAETAEGCAFFRENLPIEVWKAVGVKDAASLQKSQRFAGAVDRILYDAPAGKLPGGNGLALDWSLLANFKHTVPWGLAGGLNADNVSEAIRQTKAPLVDTSSGVESAPGVKDIAKIHAFCAAVRNG